MSSQLKYFIALIPFFVFIIVFFLSFVKNKRAVTAYMLPIFHLTLFPIFIILINKADDLETQLAFGQRAAQNRS